MFREIFKYFLAKMTNNLLIHNDFLSWIATGYRISWHIINQTVQLNSRLTDN